MEEINNAGRLAQEGQLVAFPTETVYGLGADALNPEASRKIYEAKGRPSDNPLIIHVADYESIGKIVKDLPPEAKLLADAFWPGPLTMCFQKSEAVPSETTGGLHTVAVRMPDHEIALAFIRAAGGYVAAPSANTSGKPSPTTAEHVVKDMDGRIPLILDGGSGEIGIESTIVDLSGEEISILRPGYITKEMIQEVLLKEIKVDPAVGGAGKRDHPKAPGMKYQHYAPKAELTLVQAQQTSHLIPAMTMLIEEVIHQGLCCGIMMTAENIECLRSYKDRVLDYEKQKRLILYPLGHEKDELSVAQGLYKVLRQFDDANVDVIYAECFSDDGMGQAIMNRLIRAAGHRKLSAEEVIFGEVLHGRD